MCKVYNQVGSLTTIKNHLREHNIYEYKSVKEVIGFQENYAAVRQQIISDHILLIEQEKSMLSVELPKLDEFIRIKRNEVEQKLLSEREQITQQLTSLSLTQCGFVQSCINHVKKIKLKLQLGSSHVTYQSKVVHALKSLTESHNNLNERYQYISSQFDDAVNESSLSQIAELDRKKIVIDQINSSLYGALGEQKVVRKLEELSDDYILINDLKLEFHPALYNPQKKEYIKTVQVDHILVGPSGVFIIETKNWSQQSMGNLNLYSPVEQIKRANYALYKLLNGNVSNAVMGLNKHHWGDKSVPIKNLIVLMAHKPVEEFKHVKVVTLDGLLSYINYFQPCFSAGEVQVISEYLLGLQIG